MKSSGIFSTRFWKKKLAQAADAVADLLRPQPQPELVPIPVRVKSNRARRR